MLFIIHDSRVFSTTGLPQIGNHLVPADGGETIQEFLNRVAGFEVFNEGLNRHARAGKNRRATLISGLELITG